MGKEEIDELEDFVNENLRGVNFYKMDCEEREERALKLIDLLNELLDKFINKKGSYKKGMFDGVLYASTNSEWWKIGYLFSFTEKQVSTLRDFFYTNSVFGIFYRLNEIIKRIHYLKIKMMKGESK